MSRRPVQIPLYALLVLVFAAVSGPPLSIYASVQIAEVNAKKQLIQQQRTEEAARVEARRVACSFFSINLETYDETPPSTAAGKNLQQTYLEFYRISRCQPSR